MNFAFYDLHFHKYADHKEANITVRIIFGTKKHCHSLSEHLAEKFEVII